MEINVAIVRLEVALRAQKSNSALVTVVVDSVEVSGLRPPGIRLWFEYRCWESLQSSDAEVWYRSHQQVEVLRFADCERATFATPIERGEAGLPLVYTVRFDDGLERDVFEDELLDSRTEFERPDPPGKRTPLPRIS